MHRCRRFTISWGKKINGYIKTYLYDPNGTNPPTFPTIPPLPSLGIPTVLAGLEERRELWVPEIRALTLRPFGRQFENSPRAMILTSSHDQTATMISRMS